MNILIPNKFTSSSFYGDTPPNSYDKNLFQAYNDLISYSKGDIVYDIYITDYTNGSDNDYEVWYMCNRDETVGLKPHENPLFWTILVPDNQTAYKDRYMDTKTVSS